MVSRPRLLGAAQRRLRQERGERALLEEELSRAYSQAMRGLEAQLEQQRAAMEKLRPKPPQDAVSDEQLAALQARIGAVHEAKLLSDDEFFELEDLCADFAELQSAVTLQGDYSLAAVSVKLHKLVSVSEKMTADAAFARQARRKFVS